MAGIVASTLRRKAFHKKPQDAKYQAICDPGGGVGGPGAGGTSPTDSRSTSGSSSPSRLDGAGAGARASTRTPKGAQLCQRDFWPTCLDPAELDVTQAQFETFDTLVPKANAWLHENANIHLIKCETVEKKVSAVDEVLSDCVMFIPKSHKAIYVKGLRLWFVHRSTSGRNCASPLPGIIPSEIGYMNVIPRCLDCSGKYPVYENLPDTYAAINAYLTSNPLEGRILTIETVSLKLPRRRWRAADIKPDDTCFADEYMRHVLHITRIYFCYGPTQRELIGAQDFLPDFERSYQWYSLHRNVPRYSPLYSAMRKARDWMHGVRHVSITNIQTLEAVYRRRPGNVHTGVNFVEKAECCATIRFVRVTYVRPAVDESTDSHSSYSAPSGFSYKTFVPSPVKVAMCSGAPEYEPFAQAWERSKAWLRSVDRRIIGVETVYHPLHRVWHCQDGAETSVMHGEWTSQERWEKRHNERRKLVSIVRVYLDGDYLEPPSHLLPPLPMVEEVNDCRCVLM